MAGPILSGALALALASAVCALAPTDSVAEAGALETSAAVEPAQYRDPGRSAARGSLFDAPSVRQRGSLFRPRSGRIGPHYEPPSVTYKPPATRYEPPTIADRTVRGGCRPRTRAWYDYCAARFRSFDPNRGTYTTHSGRQRPCRCP